MSIEENEIVQEYPLVSILIPLYNAEKYLAECLDSIINQKYKNLEVIIVNDGSTDNSILIAEEYSQKYKWIKVFSQENSGASAARNRAFSFSKGEYIQYLDADDCLHPDKIFFQVQRLQKESNTTLYFGKCDYFQGEKQNTLVRHLNIYDKNYLNACEFLYTMWLNAEALPPLSYLVHRSLIEASGGWNEELTNNDDGEFFARVITSCGKIIYVPESISYYRMDTPNSLSKQLSDESALSVKKSLNSYVKCSKKCSVDFTYPLRTAYTFMLVKMYPFSPDVAREMEEEKEAYGIKGYRYPKNTKVYSILFSLLGIQWTSKLHHKLLRMRDVWAGL